ncbi:MAG: hypothetical protein GY915_00185 [bacterium]|nr:hypothetical protein [bacterium]
MKNTPLLKGFFFAILCLSVTGSPQRCAASFVDALDFNDLRGGRAYRMRVTSEARHFPNVNDQFIDETAQKIRRNGRIPWVLSQYFIGAIDRGVPFHLIRHPANFIRDLQAEKRGPGSKALHRKEYSDHSISNKR